MMRVENAPRSQRASVVQNPAALLMVRPRSFGYDPDTAATNVFQHRHEDLSDARLRDLARDEFDGVVRRLQAAGVDVCVAEEREDADTPDAVFPNNWISLHADGTVVIYPMCAPRRRRERRPDLLEHVAHRFQPRRIVDLTHHERGGRFLEGTGSVVFDHIERLAYASVSPRTNVQALRDLCGAIGYAPVVFHATDRAGQAIYHTNVVMSIGSRFAIVCHEAIRDAAERRTVLHRLRRRGDCDVITITYDQLEAFAANILEVQTPSERPLIAMSTTAAGALTANQRQALETHADIVAAPIPWIERVGGGSVRCMLAGVPGE